MTVVYISRFFMSPMYRRKLWFLRKRGANIIGVAPSSWSDGGRREKFTVSEDEAILCRSLKAYMEGSGSLYVLAPLALARLMRHSKPDVVHIDEEPWSLACLQALLTRSLVSRTARVVFDTSENLDKWLPPPFGLIERYTFKVASAATAVSEEVKARLRKRGFHKPVFVVGHGIDPGQFAAREKPTSRARLGLPTGFLVGYAGVITARKGVFVLLEAFRRTRLADSKLVLIGTGDALRDVEAIVATDSFLRKSVLFVGPVAHHRMPDYLAALDVLVLPSLSTPRWKEQFGRVLIEAMACGVAVVGSNSGGIPEVIGEGGIVVPEGDVDGLADVLATLHRDGELRTQVALRGREWVLARYTWDRIAQQVVNVYQTVLHC